LRQALEVEGRVLSGVPAEEAPRPRAPRKPDPAPLLRWAEGSPLIRGPQPYMVWLARLPLLTVPLLLVALVFDGRGPGRIPGLVPAVLALLLCQAALLLHTAPRVSNILLAVASR